MTATPPETGGAAPGAAPALGAADALSLAAAPTFAIMALATGLLGGGVPDTMCPAPHHSWALTGMVPMYLLMAAFHAAPWLRLLPSRRGHVHG
jgi:hypothetical protein